MLFARGVHGFNASPEKVIEKMKIRNKTVRGDKSVQGLLNGLMLAGSGIW